MTELDNFIANKKNKKQKQIYEAIKKAKEVADGVELCQKWITEHNLPAYKSVYNIEGHLLHREYPPFNDINPDALEDIEIEVPEKVTIKESLTVDPKQSCAMKKLTFDTIPITLKLIAQKGCQSGADKYGPYNWLRLESDNMSMNTYLNAVERHLMLYRAGQDYTSDTNIHNLDSIICGLAVLRDAMIFGKVKDDRNKLSEEQIKTLESIINKEKEI